MKLTGKKALITGGNSGIGLATGRLFIAEGAQVAITGRDQKTLDEAIAELGSSAAHIASPHGRPRWPPRPLLCRVPPFQNPSENSPLAHARMADPRHR